MNGKFYVLIQHIELLNQNLDKNETIICKVKYQSKYFYLVI
jgi:hypothetical protein